MCFPLVATDGSAEVVLAMAAAYGNFNDPFGLVLRMLQSRDPAARSALLRAAGELAVTPLDWALSGAESRRLRKAEGDLLPIVLIVGLPRSGTTLVYQQLARHLPFDYFDNLGALFPRSTITVSAWVGDQRARMGDDDRSYYGNTQGLHGVNDAFHVWNRWLGEDRYEVPKALDAEARADMRRFFQAWFQVHRRPLVNKNNRNTFCIGLLASALESAYVVSVRREPVYVAQSLLKARELIQGDRHRGWGLGAHSNGYVHDPDPLVDVANQVVYCQRELQRQLQRVPRRRVIEVDYEGFCTHPAAYVRAVWDHLRDDWPAIQALGAPQVRGLEPFRNSDRADLPPADFDRLRSLVAGS